MLATLLAIECLDEIVFGAREAAWPLIRGQLHLTYGQIGLALSVPNVVASVVEPALGVLGDVWKRRVVILSGGLAFAGALLLFALSHSFLILLLASCLLYPASGAFVSLSQATLMDLEPERHEQNMTHWTFSGSVGAVAGPLLLAGAIALGGSWRTPFIALAALTLLLVLASGSAPSVAHGTDEGGADLRSGVIAAAQALRRPQVLRWIVLLQSSDLMLDVMLGFVALYFVDVGRVAPARAGLAVAVWTVAGLCGGLVMIPLLERYSSTKYLRVSVLIELALYPAFLLVPNFEVKLALLGLVGIVNSGWYPVLQGRLYSAMPGQSGTVMAVGNVGGLAGSLVPLVLGLVAQHAGLTSAMWCIMIAPIALMAGVPLERENAGEA